MEEIKSTKVLIIDDEARIRTACQEILTNFGLNVSLAKDGESGIELIKKNTFDIILLDLMMPRISGLDVLSMIKTFPTEALVIVITGYSTLEHSVEAMQNGAFDFISKPFTPDTLKVVITKAIKHIYDLRDITDNRSRMKSLISRLAEGVMCLNRDGNIVLVNHSFLKFLNIDENLMCLNQHYTSIIYVKKIKELISQATRSYDKSRGIKTEIEIVSNESSERKVLAIKCTSFYDYSNRKVGFILVINDITSFRELDIIKSEFVSIVSHEIRSPMASIAMQIDLILNGLVGEVSDKQQIILRRVSNKIDTLVKMTTELLDLSKIDYGNVTDKKELININTILRKQFEFYEPLAASNKIAIFLKVLKKLPLIHGNTYDIEEIISNLLTNGLKYNTEGGKITVTTDIIKDKILLEFTDNGIGISEEDQLKIFDKFYRIKNEQTKNIEGTGLGLSIVRKLVETYNGKIEINSIVNRGTIFSIYLPIGRGIKNNLNHQL